MKAAAYSLREETTIELDNNDDAEGAPQRDPLFSDDATACAPLHAECDVKGKGKAKEEADV
jgi:hypothetical protein